MPRRNRKAVKIRDARQLRAIRTPFRQGLLQSIVRLGPVSVKELADALDRPPASLYYHIHALEKAGLITGQKQDPHKGGAGNTYEAVANHILVDRSVRSPAFARALLDLHRAALNQTSREIERALRRERMDETPEGEGVVLLRLTACLSRREAQEARRRLRELAQYLDDHSRMDGDETLSLTATLVKVDQCS